MVLPSFPLASSSILFPYSYTSVLVRNPKNLSFLQAAVPLPHTHARTRKTKHKTKRSNAKNATCKHASCSATQQNVVCVLYGIFESLVKLTTNQLDTARFSPLNLNLRLAERTGTKNTAVQPVSPVVFIVVIYPRILLALALEFESHRAEKSILFATNGKKKSTADESDSWRR